MDPNVGLFVKYLFLLTVHSIWLEESIRWNIIDYIGLNISVIHLFHYSVINLLHQRGWVKIYLLYLIIIILL